MKDENRSNRSVRKRLDVSPHRTGSGHLLDLKCQWPKTLRAALRSESECERSGARIARDQGQHVPSPRRTGHQAKHAGPVEARHAVRADVSTADVAHRLSIDENGHGGAA
jgi:hypothetical protein